MKFRENVWPGQTVTLSFRSPDYESYDLTLRPGIRSSVAKALRRGTHADQPRGTPRPAKKATVVSNIRIRYTVNSKGDYNVGSAVKPFRL